MVQAVKVFVVSPDSHLNGFHLVVHDTNNILVFLWSEAECLCIILTQNTF